MGQVFGTQIRHACPQPSAIRGLVLPVVRAPFVALLVSALRVRHDDLARLVTAPAGAIFLAPIARPTDRQELLAAGAREEPVIEHDLERADFLPWLSFSGEAASRRRDLARQGRPGVAAPGLRPIGRVPFPRNPPPSGLRNFRRSICRPQITRIGVAGHSVFSATAERAKGRGYVYVVIDGSSLSLPDETGRKGFGPVGTRQVPVSGVMVTSALAVAGDGTPLGLIDQTYWSRSKTLDLSKYQVWQRNQERPFEDKEPAHFVRCAQHAIERLRNKGVHPWIIIDREADNRDILLALSNADCVFTVRASYDRYLAAPRGSSLRAELQQQPLLGSYDVLVGRTGNRPARRAVVEVRAQRLELLFRARLNKSAETLGVTAVWVHEKTDDPKAPLDWILYTNAPVINEQQARCIVEAYRARWRIEEFHRTWKQGECNVEDAQLRSLDAVIKWATILAAVATRIERLKYSSRTHPSEPALTVLTSLEIEVLQADQRDRLPKGGRRKKPPPVESVSIAEATTWIAQLGGWIGKRNGPPGSITLARGLERLGFLVQGVALARAMKLTK